MDWAKVERPSMRDAQAGWTLMQRADQPGGHVVDLSLPGISEAVLGRCLRLLHVLEQERWVTVVPAGPDPRPMTSSAQQRIWEGRVRWRVELLQSGREQLRRACTTSALTPAISHVQEEADDA